MRHCFLASCLASVLQLNSSALVYSREEVPREQDEREEFQGTYQHDRWLQHRFVNHRSQFAYFSLGVDQKLSPHRGVPVQLNAKAVRRGITKGSPLISEVGSVTRLAKPVEITLKWQEPKEGPTELYRKVPTGRSVVVNVTARNLIPSPLSLAPETLRLVAYVHQPSDVGTNERPTLWFSFQSPLSRSDLREIEPVVGYRTLEMTPRDGVFDMRLPGQRTAPGLPPFEAKVLAPGESRTWKVTIENVPPNEYEIAVVFEWHERGTDDYLEVVSNLLRADVLSDKGLGWQGLHIDLEQGGHAAVTDPEGIPVTLVMRNIGKKPLRMMLNEVDETLVLSEYLVCYDSEGTLIPIPFPQGELKQKSLRLEPGTNLTTSVRLPPKTALARVVFFHRFVLTDTTPEETALGNGYVFSKHLQIPKNPR